MPSLRPSTKIREVTDPRDPAVKAAYALLTKSFHRSERVELKEWTGSLREKAGKLLTDIAWHLLVAEQQGRVVGLTSGTYLGNVNVGVIGYLAITADVQSQGIGTRLRGRLRRQFARDAEQLAGRPLAGIVGEVSADNPWLRSLARNPDVLLLDLPYFQPSLYHGDEASPFVLYYESLVGPRDKLPANDVRRLLYTVWRRVYRISRPLDRPAFRAMMRALAKRRSVGRRPLSPERPE